MYRAGFDVTLQLPDEDGDIENLSPVREIKTVHASCVEALAVHTAYLIEQWGRSWDLEHGYVIKVTRRYD